MTAGSNCISKEEARRFLVKYHGLDGGQGLSGKDGIMRFMNRVGCIQYDPLNVAGRNADLVLQSRIVGYRPRLLEELLYTDRSLVDGYDKMMCIYRTEDFGRMARVRKAAADGAAAVMRRRGQTEALELLDVIREDIRRNGPAQAKDFSIGCNRKGRWGPKKLSSSALDYLYNTGELSVAGKTGTQKIFDFTENLFHEVRTEEFQGEDGEAAFFRWYVKRRIGSVGMLWNKNGGAWLGRFVSDRERRGACIRQLLDRGELREFRVEGIEEPFYMRTEDADVLNRPFQEGRTVFMAPLDNLLWDREMLRMLFDFTYSWEVYLPADKRKFGYYVLPVLYGSRFAGRFEPEQYRQGDSVLRIKNWWWEEGCGGDMDMRESLADAWKRFGAYLGAERTEGTAQVIK